jgi:hypothetical protein
MNKLAIKVKKKDGGNIRKKEKVKVQSSGSQLIEEELKFIDSNVKISDINSSSLFNELKNETLDIKEK